MNSRPCIETIVVQRSSADHLANNNLENSSARLDRKHQNHEHPGQMGMKGACAQYEQDETTSF